MLLGGEGGKSTAALTHGLAGDWHQVVTDDDLTMIFLNTTRSNGRVVDRYCAVLYSTGRCGREMPYDSKGQGRCGVLYCTYCTVQYIHRKV